MNDISPVTPPVPANPRAAIGGNNPPEPTPRERIAQQVADLQAAGSAWVNNVSVIKDQETADAAAALKRQCDAALAVAEKQRKNEKAPVDKAGKEIQDYYNPLKAKLERVKDELEAKLKPYLIEQDRKQREAEEAAERERIQAEEEAQRKADEAWEASEAARRGELAGTSVNTLAAVAAAEEAQARADDAAAEAERVAKQKGGAGGQYVINGSRRTVGLRARKKVVLDIPPKAPKKVLGVALSKIAQWIVENGTAADASDLRAEVGRLAQRVFKASNDTLVPPGCKAIEETSVV